MTRVDFFEATGDELAYACRLIARAWRQGHAVYAHMQDAEAAAQLDERLWSFRADSFVPHARVGEGTAPVLIGHDAAPPPEPNEVLVNLATEVPGFYAQFTRVAELIPADKSQRAPSRARYAFYKDQGLSPTHHKQAT